MYTSNIALFTSKCFESLAELSTALGKADLAPLREMGFYCGPRDEMNIYADTNTGEVYLQNDDYSLAKVNPETGEVEPYYQLPEANIEGFAADLYQAFLDGDVVDLDDILLLSDYFSLRGMHEEEAKVSAAIPVRELYARHDDGSLTPDELNTLADALDGLKDYSGADNVRWFLERVLEDMVEEEAFDEGTDS